MRNLRGIFVEADAPEFLENEIEAEREVIDLNGLLPVVLASLVVFALAWCTVRGTAWAFTYYGTA